MALSTDMTPIEPPNRRPCQPHSTSGVEMVTHTLEGTQRWRQLGWIDHLGRMYDFSENPRQYRVASYSPLWILVDNEVPISNEAKAEEATDA